MDCKLFIAIRKLNGLNQYGMADKLGISRSLVAKIEIGERRIEAGLAAKVKEAFGEDYVEKVKELTKEDIN